MLDFSQLDVKLEPIRLICNYMPNRPCEKAMLTTNERFNPYSTHYMYEYRTHTIHIHFIFRLNLYNNSGFRLFFFSWLRRPLIYAYYAALNFEISSQFYIDRNDGVKCVHATQSSWLRLCISLSFSLLESFSAFLALSLLSL